MAQTPSPGSRRTAMREAARRDEQRKRRRRLIGSIVAAAVALVAVITAVALLTRPGVPVAQPTAAVSYPNQSRGHAVGTVTYDAIPPVGGDHAEVGQNCGIYTEPVEAEYAVHSLEHGAVWITYDPALPADDVATLQALVRGRPYALLSPAAGLPAPVVASAWGVQLQLPEAGDPRVAEFLTAYLQGPQTPEPGASCFGGVGTPVA